MVASYNGLGASISNKTNEVIVFPAGRLGEIVATHLIELCMILFAFGIVLLFFLIITRNWGKENPVRKDTDVSPNTYNTKDKELF